LELVHLVGFTYRGPKVEKFFSLKSAEKQPIRVFLVEKHIGDVIFVLQAHHFVFPECFRVAMPGGMGYDIPCGPEPWVTRNSGLEEQK
jgi:hypothetical protein